MIKIAKDKKKYNRSLFIGRFQPFHLGHIWMAKQALKVSRELIIAIGSAEDSYIKDNPLTSSERIEIIIKNLKEESIPRDRFMIVPVRNINNYALWVKHVEVLLPRFEALFTGSLVVKSLFERENKYFIHFFNDKKKELKISATSVRDKIISGDKSWKKMLSGVTTSYLESINIEQRLMSCE